jgi:glucokinase
LSKQNLIGIDLGATNIRVAKVCDDQILNLEAAPITDKDDADSLIQQIKNLISSVITEDVQAIGVGVPSVVDVEKGIVYDVQNIPSWKKVHLKDILEDQFNVPTFINNDANCFALGEKHFGVGKEYSSMVGLILGTGFGSGLIFNNKLYSGANCGAGEVGMLPYKKSIFEHYCSGQFFEIHKNTSGIDIFEKAQNGDDAALSIYKELGQNIGDAIKAVVYTYDPELIVLGGSGSKGFSFFKDEMFKSMNDFAYTNSMKHLKIEVSKLEQVAVLGAAALFLDH